MKARLRINKPRHYSCPDRDAHFANLLEVARRRQEALTRQYRRIRCIERKVRSRFDWRLRREFGITADEYDAMLAAQRGGCPGKHGRCCRCSKWKRLYAWSRAKKEGLACRSCIKRAGRPSRGREPRDKRRAAQVREWSLRRRGLSTELVERMRKQQHGKCYVCERQTDTLVISPKLTKPYTGLVCRSCAHGGKAARQLLAKLKP